MDKQVEKSHYQFENYLRKPRWISIWHQLDEVLSFMPNSVLEIGPGAGIFKTVMSCLGYNVKTLDFDPELSPDFIASAAEMPIGESEFDVVCAFQMLEHVPYEVSLKVFGEMVRVARKGVVISLPDAATRWPFAFYIPRFGMKWIFISKPRYRAVVHNFDGEHYWEVNKSGFSLKKVLHDLTSHNNVKLLRTFRVNENGYHRFFIFKIV